MSTANTLEKQKLMLTYPITRRVNPEKRLKAHAILEVQGKKPRTAQALAEPAFP